MKRPVRNFLEKSSWASWTIMLLILSVLLLRISKGTLHEQKTTTAVIILLILVIIMQLPRLYYSKKTSESFQHTDVDKEAKERATKIIDWFLNGPQGVQRPNYGDQENTLQYGQEIYIGSLYKGGTAWLDACGSYGGGGSCAGLKLTTTSDINKDRIKETTWKILRSDGTADPDENMDYSVKDGDIVMLQNQYNHKAFAHTCGGADPSCNGFSVSTCTKCEDRRKCCLFWKIEKAKFQEDVDNGKYEELFYPGDVLMFANSYPNDSYNHYLCVCGHSTCGPRPRKWNVATTTHGGRYDLPSKSHTRWTFVERRSRDDSEYQALLDSGYDPTGA